MAAIDFPTATSNGQTFEADSGVIYTYVGTPPNGFWSGTFGTTGLTTLDGRYIAKNDSNTIQTIQTQGLKFNNGSADTILIDGVNGKIGIGTTSPSVKLQVDGTGVEVRASDNANSKNISLYGGTSANDPAITFTDALRFYSNSASAERMRIASSGNVGIGTTSPNFLLDVVGTSGSSSVAEFSYTGGNSVYLKLANASNTQGFIGYETQDLTFYTNNSERMRIDSSGRLLVGTTSASINLGLLVVQGYAGVTAGEGTLDLVRGNNVTGTAQGLGSINFGHSQYQGASIDAVSEGAWTEGSSHPSRLVFSTTANNSSSPTERMRINSSGNVGVGTTSINNKFVIASSGSTPAYFHSVNASTGTSGNDGIVMGMGDATNAYFWNYESGSIVFATNATERMRLDSSGNVGIGGSGSSFANQKTLSLFAGSSTVARLDFYNSDGSTREAEIISYSSNSESLRLSGITNRAMTFHTSNTERMRLDSSGNVNIGRNGNHTDSTARLSVFNSGASASWSVRPGTNVANQIDFISYNYGTATYLPTRSIADSWIWFDGANGERMRINSSGVLEIGKSTGQAFNGAGLLINPGTAPFYSAHKSLSGTQNGFLFYHSGTYVGGLNYTNTSTVLVTSSDYRLKENITAIPNALSRAKQLNPIQFNFISEPEETVEGFIAHELGEVVHEACHGEKDAIDENGNIKPQTIAQEKIIPLLTAAFQESITKIEALEAVDHDQFQNTSALLNQPLITFLNNSGAVAGEVIHSGINSVTYATSSDYRLKENVTDLTAAIPRLKNLAPKRFNFIGADEVTVDGFLAHEAQTVVPEAVTGTHNEVDGDGNAVMQGIDQAKLVPLLTAALQEAITKIETLETKVAALEAA